MGMKGRVDRWIFGILLGAVAPIFLSLLSISLWLYLSRNEDVVWYFVLTAFFTGLIIDIMFLKKWIDRRYNLEIWTLMMIYLFYNIGLYGMFMGFPVLNLVFGIIAGYYFGNRIGNRDYSKEKFKQITNQVSLFTASVMLLICLASAILANIGVGAGKEVQGMLHLHFEVTRNMIWVIIMIGGPGLVAAEYFLTRITMRKVLRMP